MNNIAIKINGTFLELDDVTIRFKKETTLFSSSVVPVLYSFPFRLPDTPKNIKTLGFINLPEVSTSLNIEFSCEFYLFGNFWMNGIIEVKKYYTGAFDCNLYSGIDKTIRQILSTPMRELDFGKWNSFSLFDEIRPYYIAEYTIDNPGGISYNVDGVSASYSTTWFAAWAGNVADTIQNFIDDANSKTSITGMQLSVLSGPTPNLSGGWVFTFLAIGTTNSMVGPQSIADQLTKERLIIKCLNNTFDYLTQEHANALVNEEYGSWYEDTFGKIPYRFPLIKNTMHTGVESTNPLENKYNRWDFAAQEYSFQDTTTYGLVEWFGYRYFAISVCPFISEIFAAIQRTTKYSIEYDLFKTTLADLLLITNGMLTPKDYTEWQQSPNYIDLRCSMPDMTIEEFLMGIKQLFYQNYTIDYRYNKIITKPFAEIIQHNNPLDLTGSVIKKYGYETNQKYSEGFDLHYQYDTNDQLVNERIKTYVKQKLKPPVSNIGALPATDNEQADIRYVQEIDSYYTAMVNPQTLTTTWVYFCDGQLNFRKGNAAVTIKPALSPILMSRETDGESEILLPELKQAAKVKEQSQDEHTFKGRLAFWYGLQNDTTNRKYPFASYHNRDAQNNEIGDNTLKYDTDIGIHSRYAQPYLDFLKNTRPFQFETLMKPEDVLSFDDNRPVRIESINYITHTLDFSVSNKTAAELVKVTMDIYKL
jgi:hypothetical protein